MNFRGLVLLFGCITAILSTNGFSISNNLNALNLQYGNDSGNSKLHSFESLIRFKVNVPNMEPNKCVESPEFVLNDVAWKIKACKTTESDDAPLKIDLVSVFKDNTASWSCQAQANFKLLPKDGEAAKEDKFEYHTFTSTASSKGIDKFVDWKTLKEKYTINSEATFEISVLTKTPNRTPGLEQTSAKFHMRVKELSKLGEQYSSEVVVRGIRWKVLATKQNEQFAVYVYANEDDLDVGSSWEVSAEFKLISSEKESPSKKFTGVKFDWTQSNWGHPKFMKWTELFDSSKKYVVNDATLLQIELNVGEQKISS